MLILYLVCRLSRMGGGATSLPILQFFEDIGIPIIEGYGLTETSPVVTAGSLDFSNRRLGCVGVPIPGVDVKIINPHNNEVLGSEIDGKYTSIQFVCLVSCAVD